jgi:uncharacterized protein (TIGR03083 family)
MHAAATTDVPYLDRVLPAIDAVADRFVTLATGAPDPALRVPASPAWTVRDVAAHLVTVTVRYSDGPKGRGTWTPTPVELPDLNRDQLQALSGATVGELTGRLRQELATVHAQLRDYGSQVPTFRFHGGERVRADVAMGILLGELVVHGHDVAQALRQPWPIDPEHVALIVEGVNPILPGWVRPERVKDLSASFEVRLRGQATHVWAFRDGRLHVNPRDQATVDVHISADPAALLLVLYSRQPLWRHVATGRLLAWGRKPWLALTLTSRFHQP